LRKEQSEMHKLLKAKQDLIEIQKKRIEFLTNRSNNNNTNNNSNSANSNNNNNVIKNNANQQIGGGGNGATNGINVNTNLVQNHPSLSYNQHSYQPKLKPTTKTHLKPLIQTNGTNQQSIASSLSNPNINSGIDAPAVAAPVVVTKLGIN
jgi:hypothetical protein